MSNATPIVLTLLLAQSRFVLPYMAAGQAADLLTTTQALHTGQFRERNPLLPARPGTITAVKLGLLTGELVLVHRLGQTHPTLARTIGIVVGTAGFVPAIVNLRRMRGAR